MLRGYCHWCGRYKYLERNELNEQVCGYCADEQSYIEHVHRQIRVRNRDAARANGGRNMHVKSEEDF